MEVHLGDIKAILNFFNGDEDGNTTLKDIERKISQKDLKRPGLMSNRSTSR